MSAVMPSSTDSAWRELHEAATVPYKKGGSFAWHFARGKLGRDPVFRGLIERGLVGPQRARVVDIGSGQSLIASLLSVAAAMQARSEWPARWSATPARIDYTGIELMPKDVARFDDIAGDLHIEARRLSGDSQQILYEFVVKDANDHFLCEGRAVVVLNRSLPPPSTGKISVCL